MLRLKGDFFDSLSKSQNLDYFHFYKSYALIDLHNFVFFRILPLKGWISSAVISKTWPLGSWVCSCISSDSVTDHRMTFAHQQVNDQYIGDGIRDAGMKHGKEPQKYKNGCRNVSWDWLHHLVHVFFRSELCLSVVLFFPKLLQESTNDNSVHLSGRRILCDPNWPTNASVCHRQTTLNALSWPSCSMAAAVVLHQATSPRQNMDGHLPAYNRIEIMHDLVLYNLWRDRNNKQEHLLESTTYKPQDSWWSWGHLWLAAKSSRNSIVSLHLKVSWR